MIETEDRQTTSPLSKERLRLWLKLLKVSGSIQDDIRQRLRAEFESTLPRFDVMSALARHPEGLKMSEISELLRVSNGNVTGIVDRLVADGRAVREPVPGDRRASRVRLTKAGQGDFTRQAQAHEAWVDELLGAMGKGKAGELSGLLDLILDGHPETTTKRTNTGGTQ